MANNSGKMIDQLIVSDITHYEQKGDWDCGIACILMSVDKKLAEFVLRNYNQICIEEGIQNSAIHTIDLAYILGGLRVPHLFCSAKKLSQLDYNDSGDLKTINRAIKKFGKMKSYGVNFAQRVVPIAEIIQELSNENLAICLVDMNKLYCDTCATDRVRKAYTSLTCTKKDYSGKFVVVCGYDMHRKKIYFRNPMNRNRLCVTAVDVFEDARYAKGTDLDTIFIFKRENFQAFTKVSQSQEYRSVNSDFTEYTFGDNVQFLTAV